MPIQVTTTDNGRGVVVEARLPLADAAWEQAILDLLNEPAERFARSGYSVFDFTNLDGMEDAPHRVKSIIGRCKAVHERNPYLLVAVAASDDLLFGVGRMLEALVAPVWEAAAFRTLEEAKSFIRKRVAKKHDIHDITFS